MLRNPEEWHYAYKVSRLRYSIISRMIGAPGGKRSSAPFERSVQVAMGCWRWSTPPTLNTKRSQTTNARLERPEHQELSAFVSERR